MSKAQEIRAKAQQIREDKNVATEEEYVKESEKIFDWILSIFEEKHQKMDFSPIFLVMYRDESRLELMNESKSDEWNLYDFFSNHSRKKLFKILKETIEKEEGYRAGLNFSASVWDTKATTLRVSIK